MRHQFILVILISLIFETTSAQIKVTGKIVDDSNNPIAYSNVIIKNTESDKIITGVISDDDGKFALECTSGDYSFEVSFMGYETSRQKIAFESNKNMGTIILTESANNLEGVVINAERPTIKLGADRMTFNIEKSVMASGGDMTDILKITPGVQITDDGIGLIGKGNARIMINGRPLKLTGTELITFLNSISASNIAKIEIIDTPPSEYDAEGQGGLINIIYKKGVNDLWNTSINGSFRHSVYSLYSIGASTIYNKERLSLSASFNTMLGRKEILENSTIYYPDQMWNNENRRKDHSKSINVRGALDYRYSKRSSIGFQYLGTIDRPNRDHMGLTEIVDSQNRKDSIIQSENPAINKNYNHSFNFHHETILDSIGKKLSVEFDYFKFNDEHKTTINSENFFDNYDPTGTKISAVNNSGQNIENFSSKVDVKLPLRSINLSFGAKISLTTTKNNTSYLNQPQGTFIMVPNQENNFQYDENIQALYGSAQKRFGDKWTVAFGLRLENTQTKGVSKSLENSSEEINKDQYLQLFPTAYVSYNYSSSNTWNMRYSRRVKRPAFWELNPYKRFINAYIYSEGNPFLKPSLTHNIQVSHSYKNKITSSFFISFTDDGFGQLPQVNDSSGEQFYTRNNYYKQTSYGISEGYSANLLSWWKTYNQVILFYHDVEFLKGIELGTKPFDGLGLRYSSFNTFKLSEKRGLNGEVNFWYSPGTRYRIYESTGSSGLDLGVKWNPNSQLTLSVMVNDVLNQNSPTYTAFTNNVKQEYNVNTASRYFRVSLIYKMGNNKVIKQKRDFGNEEEQKRAFQN